MAAFTYVVTLPLLVTSIVILIVASDSSPSDLTARLTEEFKTLEFLERIFQKYGTDDIIPFEGFEHLLANLGLGNVSITDHDIHDHVTPDEDFREFHDNHQHPLPAADVNATRVIPAPAHKHVDDSEELTQRRKRKKDRKAAKRKSKQTREKRFVLEYTRSEPINKCLGPRELLHTFAISSSQGIDQYGFLHVCPAIVYQLDERICHRNRDLLQQLAECHALFHGGEKHGAEILEPVQPGSSRQRLSTTTWLGALLAVTVISVVGFACVGVIPLLQRLPLRLYRAVLQCLVAMAVGTLTGDALLHLIPHAMVPHAESDHSAAESGGHGHSVYTGLCVLCGLYVFFVMERLVGVVGKCRASSRKTKSAQAEHGDPQSAEYHVGRRLASQADPEPRQHPEEGARLMDHADRTGVPCEEKCHAHVSSPGHVTASSGSDMHVRKDVNMNNHRNNSHKTEHIGEEYSHGHGHSHGHSDGSHGHSHEVPENMSSIVWMVVMGDGFHNFCDGLAIGAAFASSLTGGFSTSVAVFFHELPHEIGDFAVLLNAGMPTRQALFYNVVSSVLCFIGLVLGILIGNFSSATPIIFAVTGGMFIYISLADMLPELSQFTRESKRGGDSCVSLVMQCVGITAGLSIMLFIALYEDALAGLLDTK